MWPLVVSVVFLVSFAVRFTAAFAFSFSPLPIDLPGADFISPEGINDNEQIVGTFRWLDDGVTPTREIRTHGFLLEGDTFTPIDVPESTTTSVSDINNAGQMVGSFGDANGDTHGFILTGSTFTPIDVPGATLTAIRGINDRGEMVGIFDDASGDRSGFWFDGSQFRIIEFPQAVSTYAEDVNAAGQIVGTYVGGAHGFLVDRTALVPFDVPSSRATILTTANDVGQIAGIFDDAAGVRRSFVFDGTTVYPFSAPGAVDTEVSGMNNKGQLVGAFHDGQRFIGFIATPQAERTTRPIASVVANGTQAPHVAANTLDGDLDTRWSAQGDGASIRYELETPMVVQRVAIAWHKGDSRFVSFDVEVSMDAQTWTVAQRGQSSGATLALQTVHLPDLEARYVRIVGHGGSQNDWTSITEVQIEGRPVVPSQRLSIASVSSSAEEGPHVAANTLDGDLDTRWSARGEGVWIQYELAHCDTVSAVHLAWHRGDNRVSSFDIETSVDGVSWRRVYRGGSSGGTLALQTIDIMDDVACFVRIVGFGNSMNDWTSISEVELRHTEASVSGSTP